MEQVITVGNHKVMLDFTGLFEDSPGAPEMAYNGILSEGEYKSLSQPQERPNKSLKKEQATLLLREHEEADLLRKRSLEIYRNYLENQKASGQLQAAILKGIQAGEPLYSLFLQAARAISLMTGDQVFYNQVEADILAIYGAGLLQAEPLRKDLEDTRERLQRLRKSQERERDPDTRERIKAAISAHESKVDELESILA